MLPTPQRLLPFVALATCLFLISCTTLYTESEGKRRPMTSGEIRQYAEDVFRYHNRVETKLLTALGLADVNGEPRYDALLAAEARMLDACEALNELAIRHRDQKRLGFFKKIRLPRTIAACESETKDVERLLDTLGPK